MLLKRIILPLVLKLFIVVFFVSSGPDIALADHRPGHIGGPVEEERGGASPDEERGGASPDEERGGGSPGDPRGQPAADTNIELFDPLNKSIEEIFLAILDIIIVFAIPIVLFFIVWAGFLYVTARGDTSQLEKAHKALLYAVIGGLIVVGAQALLSVIKNTISLFG